MLTQNRPQNHYGSQRAAERNVNSRISGQLNTRSHGRVISPSKSVAYPTVPVLGDRRHTRPRRISGEIGAPGTDYLPRIKYLPLQSRSEIGSRRLDDRPRELPGPFNLSRPQATLAHPLPLTSSPVAHSGKSSSAPSRRASPALATVRRLDRFASLRLMRQSEVRKSRGAKSRMPVTCQQRVTSLAPATRGLLRAFTPRARFSPAIPCALPGSSRRAVRTGAGTPIR